MRSNDKTHSYRHFWHGNDENPPGGFPSPILVGLENKTGAI